MVVASARLTTDGRIAYACGLLSMSPEHVQPVRGEAFQGLADRRGLLCCAVSALIVPTVVLTAYKHCGRLVLIKHIGPADAVNIPGPGTEE